MLNLNLNLLQIYRKLYTIGIHSIEDILNISGTSNIVSGIKYRIIVDHLKIDICIESDDFAKMASEFLRNYIDFSGDLKYIVIQSTIDAGTYYRILFCVTNLDYIQLKNVLISDFEKTLSVLSRNNTMYGINGIVYASIYDELTIQQKLCFEITLQMAAD